MTYLAAAIAILAIGLVIWRLTLVGKAPRPGTADEDVTDRDVHPPAHPDEPVPGSDQHRADHGKP